MATILFKCVAGAPLYGLATPDSDTDLKQVVVPSKRDLYLSRARPVVKTGTKGGGPGARNTRDDVDLESVALDAFLAMVCNGHFDSLDVLFATPTDCALKTSRAWEKVWDSRALFLTSRAKNMVGYCAARAAAFVERGAKLAALDDVLDVLARAAARHGGRTRLSEVAAEIGGIADRHAGLVAVLDEGKMAGGFGTRHLKVGDARVPVGATVDTAVEVFAKRRDAFGWRTRGAALDDGAEWKSLSHAVRIGLQSLEFLATGHITFPIPDAARVLDIKLGRTPLAAVEREIVELSDRVAAAARVSPLPPDPDAAAIDAFVLEVYGATLDGPSRSVADEPGTPRSAL